MKIKEIQLGKEDLHIRNWNKEVFEKFIIENSSLFYSIAYRYIKDRNEIEDILQNCYLKLWNNRKKIDEISSLKNYIYTMIKNDTLDRLKVKNKFNLELTADYPDQLDFQNNIIEAESAKIILDAIHTLSPQSQEIINLVLEGDSLAEIAKKLNISINSVKTTKYRAISRLSEILPNKLLNCFYLFY